MEILSVTQLLGNSLIVRVCLSSTRYAKLQDFFMELSEKPQWLKNRGYLHITPKIDVSTQSREIVSKVSNPNFVSKHAFFPLIHTNIKERKYKKHPDNSTLRAHSYFYKNKHQKTAKKRPLHYATHIDALIYGYYAELLQNLYENKLKSITGLSDSIIAYRKISVSKENTRGKSTINFAKESFKEIEKRASPDCIVLMFDIKSFFSELNHDLLKKAWRELLNSEPSLRSAKLTLPPDHYNVFKSATKFSYILLDELRMKPHNKHKRNGFDEKKLSDIRKNYGIECFFSSILDFKAAMEAKQFTVYKKQFVKNGIQVGIPQGLPISAVLANLYLYKFDLAVLKKVVQDFKGFYRRYSDDILIICKPSEEEEIKNFIEEEIKKSCLQISREKTETYLFKQFNFGINKTKLASIQILKNKCVIGKPLTYLGFEFYGNKMLIKSANLAKFYRRMIYSVKRKAKQAIKNLENNENSKLAVYRSRLKRLYSRTNLSSVKDFHRRKTLKINTEGTYDFHFKKIKNKHNSNYFSYVRRAAKIMGDESINEQVRKHKSIFNYSIFKHLKKNRTTYSS